ncbi:MAG: dihydroorotase [Eubacteriales bacterium]
MQFFGIYGEEEKKRIERFILTELSSFSEDTVPTLGECAVFPGFADVHVHLREPGFSYKETIQSGTMAAARGGYTDVCSMPNLNPVPDSLSHLQEELYAIRASARIAVHPYAAITVGEKGEALSDIESLAPFAVAFSDDGRGVQSEEMMREAMRRARKLGKIIVAHCEDNALLHGGYIHDGAYAAAHGHDGISSESEWRQIERDIRLVRETGCAYHVCHISTKESVSLIRKVKAEGLDITCETAPHYLLLNDSMLEEDGRFKMNPPIRGEEDRQALIRGLLDGTVDMIATDHAPHSAEEKSKGLKGSLMGVVGLETAFPVLYTGLCKTGIVPLKTVVDCLTVNPRKRFQLEDNRSFSVWDLSASYPVDPAEFLSMGKATPFAGMRVYGRCLFTVCGGKIVWHFHRKSE